MTIYPRFLALLFSTMLVLLAAVGGLNYSVDPAGVYRSSNALAQQYAARLVGSKIGLPIPAAGLDEREIARELAGYSARFDCVVIGSSHVMQMSDQRGQAFLPGACKSLLNLGVSGAGIEDHISLAFLAANSGPVRKILLGIDPWTLAFGQDARWSTFEKDYRLARSRMQMLSPAPPARQLTVDVAKLKNLFNLDYTQRSIATLRQRWQQRQTAPAEIKTLDTFTGALESVRLKDGSLVYSADYIAKAKTAAVPLGGTAYKVDGRLNQAAAIAAYREMLLWLKAQGIEPILLMTPYHPNVWATPDSPTVSALLATQAVLQALASELGLSLLGSYQPLLASCMKDEFYDFMHPTAACVARLK